MARYGKITSRPTRWRTAGWLVLGQAGHGIDGSGLATLMADVGLTNGAFYAHFDSEQDSVASAVADQLREQREGVHTVARRASRG